MIDAIHFKWICQNYIVLFSDSNNSGTIDYKKLMKEERLNIAKDKITINLPSIVRENSIVHKNSPFTFTDKNLKVTVKSNSPLEVFSKLLLGNLYFTHLSYFPD